MNLHFEALEEIPKILAVVQNLNQIVKKGSIEKRWLNTKEVAEYTGYKLETIKSKIKQNTFNLNVHYFKKDGKLLFDKTKVDEWVMGIKPIEQVSNEDELATNIVNDVIADIKI